LALWRRVHASREATYLAHARAGRGSDGAARPEGQGGGYEGVALALMAALSGVRPSELVLNVRNGTTLPFLSPEAVVEVPCTVDAIGPRPVRVSPPEPDQVGLIERVKAVEDLTLRAATRHDGEAALDAFALHPLVDSFETGRRLLREYRRAIPGVDLALRAPSGIR
jgi:6-phospho-beta-glucosidase